MDTKGKIVRDFIYVDIERLYSLYSQLFEGVADQIIQSYEDESSSRKAQKESVLKGGSIEEQVAEMSRRTENKFLHDHMYNLLEAELSEAIYEASGITRHNFRDVLGEASVIRVSGKAEISDYGRLGIFIDKLNPLAEAFASLFIYSDETVAAKKALEEMMRSMPNSKEKNQAKEQLNKLRDPKAFAKESGWSADENLVKALRLIMDFMYPDAMQIKIIPTNAEEGVEFSGVLDKRWLRIQPEFLRALYGGAVEWTWTMVGQLTHLPGEKPITKEDIENLNAPKSSTEGGLSFKAPAENVFNRLRFFERLALEGDRKIEVIVSPLAIYRETILPIKSDSQAAAASTTPEA